MKKDLIRAGLCLLATVSVIGTTTASATKAKPSLYDTWGTSALGPGYPSVVATYYAIQSLDGVQKGKDTFTFNLTVNGGTIPMYLTFPKIGGFRLHTDQTGYWETDSLQDITYATNSSGNTLMIAEDGTKVLFTPTGSTFQLDVYNADNTRLFRIASEQISFGYTRGELSKVRLEMPLAQEESIYGTGERFNELDQVGRRLLMWNVDAGYHGDSKNAELWRSYKNIPILCSNRGYTLFFNTYYSGSADIGYTDDSKYTLEFQGPQFDFYLWTGDAEENLEAYTDLTGKTLLLPKWAYQYSGGGGSAVWNNGSSSMYGKAVEVMEKYAELGTPNLAAVYVESISADDANVYGVFKRTGTRVLKWNAPDMSLSTMQTYMQGVSNSELPRVKMLKSVTQDSGSFIDFTDSSSVTLLRSYLSREISWGMSGGLLDFGELIQPTSLFRGNGLSGYIMHNFFPYWYAKGYYTALKEETGGTNFVFFSRSGTAGSQQYTAFFTGDQQANMEGLRQQLVAGLSMSASGLVMWGGDLSGYAGTPTDTVFSRGMQFSTFQPVMRSHGTASRFPWDYGTLGVSTYQTHYWLRENLLNKIYSAAISSSQTGLPMTETLTMAYPDDASVDGVYETYLFCDDLLVTPVLDENAYTYSVVFPEGTWYSLWDGSSVTGGSTQTVEAPVDKSPVYVKAGSVIPLSLAEELTLTSSMQDEDPVDALLVTIPDNDRESVYWKDESTSVTYSNTIVSDNTFRITAGSGNDAEAVLVSGVAAYGVTVNGKKLARLSEKPTAGGQTGYYVEDNASTTIYLGTSDWQTIDVSLGKFDMPNLMRSATVNLTDLANTIDGDWDTSYAFSRRTGAEAAQFELSAATSLKNIVLKWTNYAATGYELSVSADGSTWETVATKTDGFGGIEDYELGGKTVRYIRLSNITGDSAQAMLYEIEAYTAVQQVTESDGDLNGGSSGGTTGQTGGTDSSNPEESSSGSGDTVIELPGTDDQYIVREVSYVYFPTWAIVLICVGGAVLIGGGVFLIVWKKRRKKAAAAAAIAQGELPGDAASTGEDTHTKA